MKRFALGFLAGFIFFILVNLTSAHLSSDCGLVAVFGRDFCADDIARAGWPLRFYERGGFDYRNIFQPAILFFDMVIGFGISSTIGWIAARRVK